MNLPAAGHSDKKKKKKASRSSSGATAPSQESRPAVPQTPLHTQTVTLQTPCSAASKPSPETAKKNKSKDNSQTSKKSTVPVTPCVGSAIPKHMRNIKTPLSKDAPLGDLFTPGATVECRTIEKQQESNSTLSIRKLAGGKLGQCRIVFTRDSKFFFCAAGKNLKVYNVSTGQVVRTLSSHVHGHTQSITQLALNPSNHLQLMSASLDGTIKLWDFNQGTLLKTYTCTHPVLSFTFHPQDATILYISMKTLPSHNIHVAQVSLKSSDKMAWTNMVKLPKKEGFVGMDVSNNGKHLIIVTKTYFMTYHLTTQEKKRFEFEDAATAMAVHSSEPCVAVGDVNGKIKLWYYEEVKGDATSIACTTLHWHAHKVSTLAFTADGAYMLSGGEEGVLVLWQLQTRHKDFLPRLGSEIMSVAVSPDQTLLALGHYDNSVRIVSTANMTIKQAVTGLKCAQVDHKKYPLQTGLVIEPRNDHVVLNGVPGTIQFYNCFTDRHVMELEIAPRNRISRREEKEISMSHVQHVAFSEDGEWMATVDKRDDGEYDGEVYLKFWSFDGDAFVVNTRIDMPHTKDVTSLHFCPTLKSMPDRPLLALTCSQDKTFKLWELLQAEGQFFWNCRSVGFYKDAAARDACFSQDGSLLAVAYGQVITLWDPYKNSLEGTLTFAAPQDTIQQLLFVNESPYLIARTEHFIYVWNLLTCSVEWSVKMQAQSLGAFPERPEFFLVSSTKKKCRVLIFSPNSDKPLYEYELDQKCQSACALVKRCETVESSAVDPQHALFARCCLLMLNEEYELDVLDLTSNNLASCTLNETEDALDATPTSLFSDIYGKMAAPLPTPPSTPMHSSAPETVSVNDSTSMLSIPTHMLPPPSLLIQSFLDTLLEKKVIQEPMAPVPSPLPMEMEQVEVSSTVAPVITFEGIFC